uniref:G-protein coupled receptors family 1 profile domain-containing protein n=1 Tax=Parascaris equorum TaxID=6256 RepID=A0A914RQR0_PAREQ
MPLLLLSTCQAKPREMRSTCILALQATCTVQRLLSSIPTLRHGVINHPNSIVKNDAPSSLQHGKIEKLIIIADVTTFFMAFAKPITALHALLSMSMPVCVSARMCTCAHAASLQAERYLRMMVCMVLGLVLAWLPLNLINLSRDFNGVFAWFSTIFAFCHVIAMTSAAWNPVIYSWFNPQLRMALKSIMARSAATSERVHIPHRRTIKTIFCHLLRKGTEN